MKNEKGASVVHLSSYAKLIIIAYIPLKYSLYVFFDYQHGRVFFPGPTFPAGTRLLVA
jgi:hypothetical protein